MKITFLLFFATLMQVSAASFAQKITYNQKDATLKQVFNEINKQTGYNVFWSPKLIKKTKKIDVSFNQTPLDEALFYCLDGFSLTYSVDQKTIIIKEKEKTFTERIKAAIDITGRVTDQGGKSIPGATIKVKGTTLATSTNTDGYYSLKGVDDNAVLVFSFLGFATQEIAVNNRTQLDVTLVEEVSKLDEVVVVGYGTQKRKDLTGSVSSITAKDIKLQPINSFNQALQGKVAGVQITQASNAPGGGITIRVRGAGSISGSNDPLYVVDGYPLANPDAPSGPSNGGAPYANPLSTINPNDIESIEVLKDASATAIYGSRGANGVVIVTTRRGKAGQTQVDLETYTGTQRVTKMLELGDAMDHLNLKNEQLANLGFALRYGVPTGLYPKPIASYGTGTNWQHEIFTDAIMQNHQLSITGGTEKARYLVSANYFDQDGIVIENKFKRYATRFNLDAAISDRIKFGSNFTASRTVNNGVNETGASYSPVGAAVTISPASPVYDANGNWQLINFGPGSGFSTVANPVAIQKTSTNELVSDRILGNLFGQVNLLPGLSARVSFGADILNSHRNVFYTPQTLVGSDRNGYGSNGSTNNVNLLNENTITYNKQLNIDHNFEFVAGVTFQTNSEERAYLETESFPNYALGVNNLGAGDKLIASRTAVNKWALNSYLARLNYRFKDRYLFTVTAREDGSSRFGANNKYGFFPSGAFAWRVSEESFLKNNKLLSDLKFRASYGITGNDGIGLYNSLSRYVIGRTVFNDVEVLTNQVDRIENPDLKWEKTAQLDLGVDVGFFNSRLNITADYYIKKTTDLLLNVELPATTGSTSVLRNVGSVENRGFELAINTVNIQAKGNGLNWTTSANISFNRNKVLALANGVNRFFVSNGVVQVGESVGSYYGNVFAGIWQTQAEITAAGPLAAAGSLPGAYKFADVDGNGIYNEANDRKILGNGLPRFIFGFTNTMAYKGFDLSVFLQGVQGNKIYNIPRTLLDGSDPSTNMLKEAINDHFTATNPSNQRASIRQWRTPSTFDYYLEDGSFMRVKNVTLGYQLPVKNNLVKKARVYLSAQNLLTVSNYKGFDPEVNAAFNNATVYGLDNFNYPPARTFILGATVSF